jgi:hypothetical protein
MTPDPWAFGWTQLLTISGLTLTALIAVAGFRTFERWKREKLEEKRIDIAYEALALAYETKFIFQSIRSPLSEGYEWADMPKKDGESENERNRRGPYYAIFKRIQNNKDYFEKAWQLQPRCMAVFGRSVEDTFMKLHKARRTIEIAAQMLAQDIDDRHEPRDSATIELYKQFRRDIWDHGNFEKEKDNVAKLLQEFELELENITKPILSKKYKEQ